MIIETTLYAAEVGTVRVSQADSGDLQHTRITIDKQEWTSMPMQQVKQLMIACDELLSAVNKTIQPIVACRSLISTVDNMLKHENTCPMCDSREVESHYTFCPYTEAKWALEHYHDGPETTHETEECDDS